MLDDKDMHGHMSTLSETKELRESSLGFICVQESSHLIVNWRKKGMLPVQCGDSIELKDTDCHHSDPDVVFIGDCNNYKERP